MTYEIVSVTLQCKESHQRHRGILEPPTSFNIRYIVSSSFGTNSASLNDKKPTPQFALVTQLVISFFVYYLSCFIESHSDGVDVGNHLS